MNRRAFLSAVGALTAVAAVPAAAMATQSPVWLGIDAGSASGDWTVTWIRDPSPARCVLTLDIRTAEFQRQVAELERLLPTADPSPTVDAAIQDLAEHLSDEIELINVEGMTYQIRLKPGGRYDALITEARSASCVSLVGI